MSQFSRYPGAGSTGSGGAVPAYFNFAALPTTAPDGALAVTLDDDSLYIFDGATATWLPLASVSNLLTIGTIDSQSKSANGAVISATVLYFQTADATHPGLMSTTTQTIAGAKTFTGAGVFSSTLDVTGNFNVATNKFSVIAASGNTSIAGTLALTSDFAIATNKFNVTASNGNTAIAGTLNAVGNFSVATSKFTVTASSGDAAAFGNLTAANLSGTNTGDVTIGAFGSSPTANGISIASQVITLQPADATHPGAVTTGTQTIAGAKTFSGAMIASSTLGVTGDFAVATNKFTVASATGNTLVAGTLSITSDVAVATNKFTITASSGDFASAGAGSITGALTIGGAGSITGNLNLVGYVQPTTTDFTATGTTTISASVSMVGVGTAFLSELKIGDRVAVSSASTTYRTVTAIADNTNLTLSGTLGNGTAGTTILVKKSIVRGNDSLGVNQFFVADNGAMAIGPTVNWSGVSSGGAQGFLNIIAPIASNTVIALQFNSDARYIMRRANATVSASSQGVGNVISSPTGVLSGQALGTLGFQGFQATTSTFVLNSAAIGASAVENFSSTAAGTKMTFDTTPATTITSATVLELGSEGNVVLGKQAALATNATNGFTYMPTCAGTPSGAPTAYTGKVAWVYDTTNNIIYVYNGAWKKTAALT